MVWNGQSHLQTVDCLTCAATTLHTAEGRIEAPNWTRDGRLIYNAQGALYAYHLSDGTLNRLDTGFADRCNNDHVLSPCGEWIAISHQTHEDKQSRVYVAPLAGGMPRLVTPLAPSYLHGWSPDGRMLSYCASRGGKYDIYTIPAEGGVETRLTDAPGLNDGPEYSPCGQWIWFNSERTGRMQIFRMRLDGSDQTQMTDDERNNWFPHVSPDGRWIAYITYSAHDVAPGAHPPDKQVEIRLMPADGGAPRTLVQLFGGQGTLNVNSWAPDSRRLAFVSYGAREE